MRVAVVTAPNELELREEPSPALRPDELRVKVGACGLCTMERRLYLGIKRFYPVAPGHEVAGTVIETGEAVKDLPGVPKVGDTVTVDLLTRCGACSACRRGRSALCRQPQGGALADGTVSFGAGLADEVVVPAAQAYGTGAAPIEHAAMGEPLACVVHSARLGGLRAGDRVAIIGGGYMGRLHLALARQRGAASVGLVDVSTERLADTPADWTATPETAEGEHDLVFVTAGAPGVLETALRLTGDAGTVVLYGAFPKGLEVPIDPDYLHHHEVSLIGAYSQEPQDWAEAAALIGSGRMAADLDALVTARFPLADVDKAFDLAANTPVFRVLVGG
jgi:L-iditol 2-dehydrogenase